jgi:hypothetical protein
MSALELYLAPNSESSYTCFLTTIAIIVFVGWTQMKIHLMYAGELDRFSNAFDKRMTVLEGVAKELSSTESAHEVLLKEHGEKISLATGELERFSIAFDKRMTVLEGVAKQLSAHEVLLKEHGEKISLATGELERFSIAFDKRMSALEGVAKELSAHEVLLKEHGEDISLAAETAYRAAGLPNTNEPHPRNREPPFHSRIQYVVDEPIQKFLRRSPKKTVREILSHLSHDEAAQTEWKRHTTLEMTLHDVNSRLYSLLAQTILQKDDSVARPLWSLTTLGLQRLHFSERQGPC